MKRGTTQAHTLHLNGWGIGDILEGTESNGRTDEHAWSNTNRILITAIGDDEFLCKWDYNDGKGFDRPETGNTTLFCREWKKVGEDQDRKWAAGFWGRFAAKLTRDNRELKKIIASRPDNLPTISGNVSPGVEPINSNYYVRKNENL